MSEEGWQVSSNAAEVYEQYWVPAMIGQWAPQLLDATGVAEDDKVLDVACGTGLVAREAASKVGSGGLVVGVDINVGMLAVARQKDPELDWGLGDVTTLPFDEQAFDVVVCQFALMYFPDRRRALREMLRVLRSGGRFGATVWAPLQRAAGYAVLTELVRDLAGDEAAALLTSPHELGEAGILTNMLRSAGFGSVVAALREGTAQHPSVERFVTMEVKGTPLETHIDDEQLTELIDVARERLNSFVRSDGSVEMPMDAVIVTAHKP